MKTVTEIRQAFWDQNEDLKHHYRVSKKQNDYPLDVRLAFIDYLQSMRKSGEISEKLAYRATL